MNYQADLGNLETPEFYTLLRAAAREHSFTKSEYSIAESLLNFMRKYGRAFPSVGTLAENARCSDRTVQRALKKFETLGIIARCARFAKKTQRQTSNEFILKRWVSKCHPLQSNINKIKQSISIRDLFNKLIKNQSTEKALTARFDKIASELTKGTGKGSDYTDAWSVYWLDTRPNQIFTLEMWEQKFRGWIRNSFNMPMYA